MAEQTTERTFDPKAIPSIKRKDLKGEFRTNHERWFKESEAMGLSFSDYLNRISPEPKNEADPQNAVHSLMRDHGIQMKDTAERSASLIIECIEDPVKRSLLGADLQQTYENILFKGYLSERQKLSLSTRAGVGGITAGDPFRAFEDLPVKPAEVLGNRVTLASVITRVREVAGVDIRVPEVLKPEEGSTNYNLGEAVKPPLNTISMGSRKYSMKKMGTSVGWTYEFARNSGERVTAARLWISDMAIENEADLIKEAVTTGMSTIPADNSSDGKAHANPRLPGTGKYDAATQKAVVFEVPQRYVLNSVVGGPQAVQKWELISSGTEQLALAAFAAQSPGGQSRFRNANINIAYPEITLVYTEDITQGASAVVPANNDHLDVSADQLFFFDSNNLVELARQRGSTIQARETDVGSQFVTEYFTSHYVFYIFDYNPRIKAYLS